jgi:hypothetical protein
MRALLLLAMTAFGQSWPVYIDESVWPLRSITCECCKGENCCAMACFERVPLPYEYRIDWLRPDLYIWPSGKLYDLGATAHTWGEEGFHSIYISAPFSSVVILMPNGKRVDISRAELDRRAK